MQPDNNKELNKLFKQCEEWIFVNRCKKCLYYTSGVHPRNCKLFIANREGRRTCENYISIENKRIEKQPKTKSQLAKKQAAKMFNLGFGYKAVASQLGLNRETIRDWYCVWRALGEREFLNPSQIRCNYSQKTKNAAVRDRLNGMSVIDVMAKYKIRSRHRIKNWMQAYEKSKRNKE